MVQLGARVGTREQTGLCRCRHDGEVVQGFPLGRPSTLTPGTTYRAAIPSDERLLLSLYKC